MCVCVCQRACHIFVPLLSLVLLQLVVAVAASVIALDPLILLGLRVCPWGSWRWGWGGVVAAVSKF